MKKVYLLARVNPDKCVGDRFCENVCPTGAVRMTDRRAVVDGSRCAGCLHCLDACGEGAITILPRGEPLVLGLETSEVSPEAISALCSRANLSPEARICVCMDIRAREVACAILQGARSPEEVSLMTGVRTSCGMWCMAPVQRLLRAHHGVIEPEKGTRWYPIETGVWAVPGEVARKYPEYRLEEDDEQFRQGTLENLVSIFKAK